MYLLDYILISIIAVCAINGYFKGLFKEIVDILGFILGIAVFKITYPYVNYKFLNSNLFIKLKDYIASTFNLSDSKIQTIEQASKAIDTLPLPDIIKNILKNHNSAKFYEICNINSPLEYILNFISIMLMSLIYIFLVILIITILTSFLKSFSKILKNFYLFDKLDKIGGVGFGIINGILISWLIGIVIVVLSFFPQFIGLKEQLNGFLANPLISNNYLVEKLLNLVFRIMM